MYMSGKLRSPACTKVYTRLTVAGTWERGGLDFLRVHSGARGKGKAGVGEGGLTHVMSRAAKNNRATFVYAHAAMSVLYEPLDGHPRLRFGDSILMVYG